MTMLTPPQKKQPSASSPKCRHAQRHFQGVASQSGTIVGSDVDIVHPQVILVLLALCIEEEHAGTLTNRASGVALHELLDEGLFLSLHHDDKFDFLAQSHQCGQLVLLPPS